MFIESVMPSSHLILCCPLLLLPPIPPNIRVFSSESTLHLLVYGKPLYYSIICVKFLNHFIIHIIYFHPQEGRINLKWQHKFKKLSFFTFCHKGGVIYISEVIDISHRNLHSSLCFIQPNISHDVLCIILWPPHAKS